MFNGFVSFNNLYILKHTFKFMCFKIIELSLNNHIYCLKLNLQIKIYNISNLMFVIYTQNYLINVDCPFYHYIHIIMKYFDLHQYFLYVVVLIQYIIIHIFKNIYSIQIVSHFLMRSKHFIYIIERHHFFKLLFIFLNTSVRLQIVTLF